MYKFKFNNDEEMRELIESNKDKRLIEIYYSPQENFLIFSKEPILEEKISILEAENKSLREGLQAVLNGDMQSLAYILYPKDFTDANNTTLEL